MTLIRHLFPKPSNIFLSLDGKTIKVGDFGLVVSAEEQGDDDEDSNESSTPAKKPTQKSNDGTFLYMSPEQVFLLFFFSLREDFFRQICFFIKKKLNGQDYNFKVDIYSIGIILFELIVSFDTQMERIDVSRVLIRNILCRIGLSAKIIKLTDGCQLTPNFKKTV
jgi:translation initiation factor 2-alpha kinase 3